MGILSSFLDYVTRESVTHMEMSSPKSEVVKELFGNI